MRLVLLGCLIALLVLPVRAENPTPYSATKVIETGQPFDAFIKKLTAAISGRKVRRASDVPSAVHMAHPGDSIAITFIRGGQSHRASLVLRP